MSEAKKTNKDHSAARDKRNREAGLVKISPSYWVHADRKQEALDAIRTELNRPKYKKPKE